MFTVGVLCARVRVEEKELLAALAEAGVVPTPLAPAAVPMPLASVPGGSLNHGLTDGAPVDLVVDRCHDRTVAAAMLRVSRAQGIGTIDAGLAATVDRLTVVGALAAAGIPLPPTYLAFGEAAATIALAEFGFPSTIMPLAYDSDQIVLPDIDTAEAVLEHRAMLGGTAAALALVQRGVAPAASHWTIIVVGGKAVAATIAEGAVCPAAAITLAESVANLLAAGLVGIEVAAIAGSFVAWDIVPIPEYRHARPLADATVAFAVARLVLERSRTSAGATPPLLQKTAPPLAGAHDGSDAVRPQREVRDGVVLVG